MPRIQVDFYLYFPLVTFKRVLIEQSSDYDLFFQQRNDTYQKAYYKECMKQKATNIIICPNSDGLPYESVPGQNIPALNKKLRKLRKKIRRMKRKQRKSSSINKWKNAGKRKKRKRKSKKHQN